MTRNDQNKGSKIDFSTLPDQSTAEVNEKEQNFIIGTLVFFMNGHEKT